MRDYKAIAINSFITARETASGNVLIFTPSDQTEAGHISPASEMCLSREEISKLYYAFCEPRNEE